MKASLTRLLSLPGRKRLGQALRYLLNESEFLSPHGVRSLSRVYKDRPYVFRADGDSRAHAAANSFARALEKERAPAPV